MSSIDESFCMLMSSEQQSHHHNNIFRAITEYQQRCDSDEQIATMSEQAYVIYQEFENKHNLKIKPLNMFKDLISLQTQNSRKNQHVKQLQLLNQQLKTDYELCISHNGKLEHFLKEVQFTFQPERKRLPASEIMLKAKKTLCQEAKQAKEKMKKMFKNNEASAIQELKIYMSILETSRQNLKKKVQCLQQSVARRIKEEDFNNIQAKKFDIGSKKIRKALDSDLQIVINRHQQYKIQKMLIKGKVKARNLETKKKRYKQQCQDMKSLLLQLQGLQYEMGLLKLRVKEKKKENAEYQQLLERIKFKESITLRLEKQLRQKNKTYDYMLQWSKELKKQLEGRKSEHAKKKAQFEDRINKLTTDYEKATKLYKVGLQQQQEAKKKGSRQLRPPNQTSKPSHTKLVTFQDISLSVRSLSFFLLENQIPTDSFINDILKIRRNRQTQNEKQKKKTRVKYIAPIENHTIKDTITIEEICQNFQFEKNHNLNKEEYTKLAHFIVQDRNKEPQLQSSIAIAIGKQILKNLLKREIQNQQQLDQAVIGFKKRLQSRSQNIRPDIKLAGGCEEEVDVNVLRSILKKQGLDPYYCNLYSEFLEFFAWKKRKSIGCAKLEDFDEIVYRLVKKQQNILPQLINH